MTCHFENEFSRPIVLLQIGDRQSLHEIHAEPEERRLLAKRLGLADLAELRGEIALRRVRGGTALSASGRLHAEVTQTCIVSLEPIPARLDEEFAETFVLPQKSPSLEEREVEFSFEEDLEPGGPELFSAGSFDLGEFLVQLLAERLDPYPRSPNVSSPEGDWSEAEAAPQASPFADLARKLKR